MEVGPAVAKWIKAIAKKLNDLITYKVENEKSKIEVREKNNIDINEEKEKKRCPLLDNDLTAISMNNNSYNNNSMLSTVRMLNQYPQLNSKRWRDLDDFSLNDSIDWMNKLTLDKKKICKKRDNGEINNKKKKSINRRYLMGVIKKRKEIIERYNKQKELIRNNSNTLYEGSDVIMKDYNCNNNMKEEHNRSNYLDETSINSNYEYAINNKDTKE